MKDLQRGENNPIVAQVPPIAFCHWLLRYLSAAPPALLFPNLYHIYKFSTHFILIHIVDKSISPLLPAIYLHGLQSTRLYSQLTAEEQTKYSHVNRHLAPTQR